jgi:ABC-type dipeptide/oligopeptide/nickel transport system permease subunit
MVRTSPDSEKQSDSTAALPYGKIFLRQLGNMLVTLLVIAFLTLFLLELAERGRNHLPAQFFQTFLNTFRSLTNYIFFHPATYPWQRQDLDAFKLVVDTFINSAGLLLVTIVFAALLGVLVGLLAALSKGRLASALVLTFSVMGMSTPSFLFAMLLWVFNIHVINRFFGLKALPPTGFGWDLHLLMPALVLAARPMAQIAQVTYVSLRDILNEDFIRTALAKGVPRSRVYNRHALKNILIPVLTTVGTSLRYSIASLPVVEYFFIWPGIGLTLLQAIGLGMPALVTDLIVCLGLFFVLFNLALDLLYPLIDARLRRDNQDTNFHEPFELSHALDGILYGIRAIVSDLLKLFRLRRPSKNALPALATESFPPCAREEIPAFKRPGFKQGLQWVTHNPALMIGTLFLIGFLVIMVGGDSLVPGNAAELHGIAIIEGVIGAPPFKPSATFPWGTDYLGRDIQALVFAGGQRTLSLAFGIMLARLLLGTLLGIISGWWQDSWFDRLIQRLLNIWAAFPVTLFAMLLIQAIGIEQGVWVFVLALCIVGWGEVTQFVRSQTLRIKPSLFIEAARSLGSSSAGILIRQVFPNLISSLLVIASLEMSGILMLLAELGFLNIFLGGGFRVEAAVDSTLMFSDIPEWGSLLANIRDWWRSYPWMAWYPGLAFFAAIITFNLFGEGLRRFLEDSRANISRIFNRYTFVGVAIAALCFGWIVQLQSPMGVYRSVANTFDEERVLQTIKDLTHPTFHGRESALAVDGRLAEYLSYRMEEIGLFPPEGDGSYIYTVPVQRIHLSEQPTLELFNNENQLLKSFVYRQDFTDYAGTGMAFGEEQDSLMGLALGPASADEKKELTALSALMLADKAVIVLEKDYDRSGLQKAGMLLVVAQDEKTVKQKKLYYQTYRGGEGHLTFWINAETANLLLMTANSSLEELEQKAEELQAGEIFSTQIGAQIRGSVQTALPAKEEIHMVIGVLPGEGALMGERGRSMDTEITIISAYYDGLGDQPDGALYQGANDNASGVGTMLELARLLKNSPYAPKRTILFVAWSGGERGESFKYLDIMNAYRELNDFEVNEIIEISGVGAGSGTAVNIGAQSSYRLVKLVQDAGKRLGIKTTTRGRGPHYGIIEGVNTLTPREAPSLYISWDGSDDSAHTLLDTLENIDPQKLRKSGRLLTLISLILSRENNY